MIIRANNTTAHKMADHGIQFERVCPGWYLLNSDVTFEQIKAAGLMIRVVK